MAMKMEGGNTIPDIKVIRFDFIFRIIGYLSLFACSLTLAGCAQIAGLAALPFDILDTTARIGTLGLVKINTGRAVQNTVLDITDPDRHKRFNESVAASVAGRVAAAKAEQERINLKKAYTQMAIHKNDSRYHECFMSCPGTGQAHLTHEETQAESRCWDSCARRYGLPGTESGVTEEEFREFRAANGY